MTRKITKARPRARSKPVATAPAAAPTIILFKALAMLLVRDSRDYGAAVIRAEPAAKPKPSPRSSSVGNKQSRPSSSVGNKQSRPSSSVGNKQPKVFNRK
jgi:hypothetical protein